MSKPPNVGDQYTRTQTFTVTAVDVVNRRVTLEDSEGNTATKGIAFLDRLQPVPPPVVTYGPGDTVVRISDGAVFGIGRKGYLDHTTGEFVKSEGVFTSTSFRKAVIE